MTSVVITMPSALTWRTNIPRCSIQSVEEMMKTLILMLNSLSTTWRRPGSVITKTQRSRSIISQLSMSRLRSKKTGNHYLFSCVHHPFHVFINVFIMFLLACVHMFCFVLGMIAGFTCWNTLQSGKVDGSLWSQLQWSSSSVKYIHGTGWWMKISTRGLQHENS